MPVLCGKHACFEERIHRGAFEIVREWFSEGYKQRRILTKQIIVKKWGVKKCFLYATMYTARYYRIVLAYFAL